MTAITRKENRRANDFYPTPEWATLALLKRVSIGGCILECCSGDGAIAVVLNEELGESIVATNDIDINQFSVFHHDASTEDGWRSLVNSCSTCWSGDAKPDWIVSNPPYNKATEIIPLAYENCTKGVAMLLRLSYLEPCLNRCQWLIEHPVNHLIVLPRISFTGDRKTDGVTVAWFVWRKDDSSQQISIVSR